MTSQARIEANRQNAQRSSGPRSDAGKATAAMNAVKHGLTAKSILLRDEDAAAYAALHAALLADLAPVGAWEKVLAERAIQAAWRLMRTGRAEAEMLETAMASHAQFAMWAACTTLTEGRPRPAPSNAGAGLDKLISDHDKLGKLSRYETTLERALLRALHELQRLQAARTGDAVPLPVAVDVTVSGEVGPGQAPARSRDGAAVAGGGDAARPAASQRPLTGRDILVEMAARRKRGFVSQEREAMEVDL